MNEIYINDFLLYLELDLNYSKNTINTYENSLIHYIGFNFLSFDASVFLLNFKFFFMLTTIDSRTCKILSS